MKHVDLVADSPEEYVDLSLRLLIDDEFWKKQSEAILKKFHENLLKNQQVAFEWLSFILRLYT
jgi:hypothetical protein